MGLCRDHLADAVGGPTKTVRPQAETPPTTANWETGSLISLIGARRNVKKKMPIIPTIVSLLVERLSEFSAAGGAAPKTLFRETLFRAGPAPLRA
jgi:hypothetical protein